jgi:ubiquinone/menaquinone biosynthesis C-methylase UbiE
MQSTPPVLEKVHDFWNAHPCGAHFIKAPFGTTEFFRQYADFRYRSEFHLNNLVPFDQYSGKHVLEIGCGLGADGVRFAQNGALYTGIDLTEMAVETTRLHFQILGLQGPFKVQNAEQMSEFEEGTFDLVYSHGVLHHTPHIDCALQEIKRVLKKGGRIVIMLYHKSSFNYYFRIQGYMRMMVLIYLLIRSILPEQWRNRELERHYQNYKGIGTEYFSFTEFSHHCTDDPECPIAYFFTKKEITQLFSNYFVDLSYKVAHFPVHNTIRIFPLSFEQRIASRLGGYLFIYGKKG